MATVTPTAATASEQLDSAGIDVTSNSAATSLCPEDEEEALERLFRVLSGTLDDSEPLPPLHSKIVRIFTSSTFTDMGLERNALMEQVYPRLKEFCRERHGLDFQAVDMRWGVRDEATDDHMTTELCMKEIDNCQRLSNGPNFCLFLGQKYGYRPIPTVVLATEWELLYDVIVNNSCRDVTTSELTADAGMLFKQWYKKDDNAVPAVYILQPISSILHNFNNKRRQKLMDEAQATWWSTLEKLQKTVRQAALCLFTRGLFTREQLHNFVMSVTEREVRRGIRPDCPSSTDNHCLVYIRDIENLDIDAYRSVRNFIDMFGKGEIDVEAVQLLDSLRFDLLPSVLSDTNVRKFSVEWASPDGLDVYSHAEYVKQFCETFYSDITSLVERAVNKIVKPPHNHLYVEVLQHLHMCQNLCRNFQGRREILTEIRNYVTSRTKSPYVITGESGCGKTSIFAKAYSQTKHWLDNEQSRSLTIIRFLGTSPDSSSIVPLLTSLSQQIAVYHHLPIDDVPTEIMPLVNYFKTLLSRLAMSRTPVVIYLDSLDMLSEQDGAHRLAWLPVPLPEHCHLVVSVDKTHTKLVENLRALCDAKNHYSHVDQLGSKLAIDVLTSWLSNVGRTVTSEQWSIVLSVIERCTDALFLRLVFDEITLWRSYYRRHMTSLAPNTRASIHKLFERIETQHGKVLVSHAFSYITASKEGLSESELEDVLSLDEQVLNDVYQYHLPPVRRIPPLLWTRIRSDMTYYFTERSADGATVISWYHRQFAEVSVERYLRNVNVHVSTHSLLADYFLGVWGGGKPKPFEYTAIQRERFFLDTTEGACDRKVPEQPLFFGDGGNGGMNKVPVGRRSATKKSVTAKKRHSHDYVSSGVESDDAGHSEKTKPDDAEPNTSDVISGDGQKQENNITPTNTRSGMTNSANKVIGLLVKDVSFYTENDLPCCALLEQIRRQTGMSRFRAVGGKTAGNGMHRRYNLRKLSELPFHLVRSRQTPLLLEKVLLNFRWLHAKLSCVPLNNVLADYEDAMMWSMTTTVNEGRLSAGDITSMKLIVAAIRLSASVLDKHPDMLAAQVTGRLLPYYQTHERIRQLVGQFDSVEHGLTVNGLVPVHHYLQTPGGPLSHSLEGHPFAPFGVAVTSDGRYIVTASSQLIIWDLGSGDMFHRVTLRTRGGLVRHLALTPDNRYALAVTSYNELVLCTVFTGEVKVIAQVTMTTDTKSDVTEELISLRCTNSSVLTWSNKSWFSYTLDGTLTAKGHVTKPSDVFLYVSYSTDETEIYLVTSSNGDSNNKQITLNVVRVRDQRSVKKSLDLYGAVALSRDQSTVYTLGRENSTGNDVICYKMSVNASGASCWNRETNATLQNNDEIYSLILSKDEQFLIGTTLNKLKRWHIPTRRLVLLHLPAGVRVFPSRNCFDALVTWTKNNAYVLTAVRKAIYVWDGQTGSLVKTLDTHFGRVLSLFPVVAGDRVNKVVSSSIDKSIKVWNVEYIRESMFTIHRLDKPIDSVSVGGRVAVTCTRTAVGVWSLDSGELTHTLVPPGQRSTAIITHSTVTSDGRYIVAAEANLLHVWNADSFTVVTSVDTVPNVTQLILTPDNTKLLIVSRQPSPQSHKAFCTCHQLPSGQVLYRFDYTVRGGTQPVPDIALTSDGNSIVLSAIKAPKHRQQQQQQKDGSATQEINYLPPDILLVKRIDNGETITTSRPKYSDYRDYVRMLPLPNSVTRVALFEPDEQRPVVLWDWKRKVCVRHVTRWTGQLTSDGLLGLYGPSRGGLDIVDMKSNEVVRTLIPRVAEGVFNIRATFTANNRHVVYYHSGHQSIRVFRVEDGQMISHFKSLVKINDFAITNDGLSVVLGAVDGSLVVLVNADCQYAEGVSLLNKLPSRQLKTQTDTEPSALQTALGALHRKHLLGRLLKRRATTRNAATAVEQQK